LPNGKNWKTQFTLSPITLLHPPPRSKLPDGVVSIHSVSNNIVTYCIIYKRLSLQHRAYAENAIGKAKTGPKTEDNLSYNIRKTNYGTNRIRAHRKLAKDAPELDAKVRAGELSSNAAMIQAGFRKPMASVQKTREGFAKYII